MTGETGADPLQDLVQVFRGSLEEGLILAIANDYDLQQESQYNAARAALKGLAEAAGSEEANGFNPSGIPLAVDDHQPLEQEQSSSVTNSPGQAASHSLITDSSGTGVSALSADAVISVPNLTSFDNDSDESKILQLQTIFPDLKEYDVKYSLKKFKGDFQAALDDLLSIQYLQSTGKHLRGVDGFFQPDEVQSPTRSKRRGKKSQVKGASTPPSSASDAEPTGREQKHQDDIAYLADLFDVPFAKVSEVYYKKGCSSGAAAIDILDEYLALGIEAHDDAGKKHAQELIQKYRQVPEKYMSTIVQVSGSIPKFADDLAALLNKHFTKHPWTQKLNLSYSLTPLPQEDIEGSSSMSSPTSPTRSWPAVTPRPSPARASQNYAQANQNATTYNDKRREALTSAAQMSRRGASSPLYRQAAGYYAERAREQGYYAVQASSDAADLLVDQTKTSKLIDLHGVQVQDGVRIARQRVQEWWDNLGEFRSRKAKEQPFTVITGLGRHSAGGVSQMRQAVARALLQDGWRMQVDTGRFVVAGRR